ncbi:hypothetical protein OF829_12040 [Sphingomonas sp. LB-2]|uniref:hypothetical protein n=1 Tax=Sphingomonas caeni TaxID=2984949 RepID=UPI002231ABE8|nr:hypothetical protein [Sphingomonas caeni]MCW3847970.1 hypothetical protein [Sphingomonas caeni]
MFKRIWAIALIAMFGAAVAPAHAQTTIEVPANAGWKHGETGLILRSRITGIPRGMIVDNSASELDVMAQYESPDGQTYITVYIFRPALASVPVWFDRSETALLHRDIYGNIKPASDAPTAFAPPRGTVASGLRRIYAPGKGFRSTGLAMMPLGKWLVAVRVSSNAVGTDGLDAKLSEVIAGIGWPEGVAEGPAAAPIAPCAQPLAYAKRARMRKPDMADGLMGSTMMMIDDPKLGMPADPKVYCRDLPPQPAYGVYRAPDATNSYVMAVGDAGIAVRILPEFDEKHGSMVIAGFLDHASVYPPFEALPHPDDVMQALRTTAPLAQVSADGKNVTLNMQAK